MLPRARPAWLRAAPGEAVLEDRIVGAVFASFPLLGLVLTPGEALTLAGVGLLAWMTERIGLPTRIRRAQRRFGTLLREPMPTVSRSQELAFLGALLIAGMVAWLASARGSAGAVSVFLWTLASLALVFGVHRAHLTRTRADATLVRVALLGVTGACLVAALRA